MFFFLGDLSAELLDGGSIADAGDNAANYRDGGGDVFESFAVLGVSSLALGLRTGKVERGWYYPAMCPPSCTWPGAALAVSVT